MKDNFSRQAEGYKTYRPEYPEALFEFILKNVRSRSLAWDAGTGNGQTAHVLARYFDEVIATDISAKQLLQAPQLSNVSYKQEPAEATSLRPGSVNLVTVSQALHWFSFDAFYAEVRRVAAPGAVIAVWTYSLLNISPEIDLIINDFHDNLLGDYWDPERKHVNDGYASIPFPFQEVPSLAFRMEHHWTLPELEGYLNTWSAVQQFMAGTGYNPVVTLIHRLAPYWAGGETRLVVFPLHLKIGAVR